MRLSVILGLVSSVLACDSCYGPVTDVVHERLVRRMQPEAQNAVTGPSGPLPWGQLNFLHTTDTHGWLEGHLKEKNYGADWGDFVSFSKHMKHKAGNLGVDLLLVDTGDLHDGSGLSDAALPNGVVTNPIFEEIDYDILTIGNHELYVSEIAYEHFYNFSKVWGEKYVTSNVQILNPATGQFEYIGAKYRYFTTDHGLRIMAFGVLFDFTGNSNVSKVTKGKDMVKQQWFLDAVNFTQPIDLFLVAGHNPILTSDAGSTFGLVRNAIRAVHPTTPIQVFGGHSHIRAFQAYDETSTGLESGRYCETLGWLSIGGINSSTYTGIQNPRGVPNPTTKATNTSTSSLVYSRKYLDWNRLTFQYHSSSDGTFDIHSGLRVTSDITAARKQLGLASVTGCAPQTYCQSCVPFGSAGNIFTLTSLATAATVVNASRSTIPRITFINTGSIRFDLYKGPFTYDDSFIVSPFTDKFLYIANVPYAQAYGLLNALNGGAVNKRSMGIVPSQLGETDSCIDPIIGSISSAQDLKPRGVIRRQALSPGYITTDSFGTDGDDTPHAKIPNYRQPNYAGGFAANASFPADGSNPVVIDVVFLNFITANVITALNKLGGSWVIGDVTPYVDTKFNAQSYLPAYAKLAWQANSASCPVS